MGTEAECINRSYPSQHLLEKEIEFISIIFSFHSLKQKNGSRKKNLLLGNHWENSLFSYPIHYFSFPGLKWDMTPNSIYAKTGQQNRNNFLEPNT